MQRIGLIDVILGCSVLTAAQDTMMFIVGVSILCLGCVLFLNDDYSKPEEKGSE